MPHVEQAYAAVRSWSRDSPGIYLTFDDGPDEAWTPRVLEALDGCAARATFFVIGRAARRSPQLVRSIVAAGHEVANHGYSHRHPWTMSARDAKAEVRDGADAIAQSIGVRPRMFRPAHGRMRRAMAVEAVRSGQHLVLWSLSAIDWGPLARANRIEARIARARAGDIVLMHDGRNRSNRPDVTVDVLPRVLQQFAVRNLRTALLPALV